MNRITIGVSVIAVALSGAVATAQPPDWAGHPPPVGELFGYSPLVPRIDPFPSRTSGYAHSMFNPRNGGKRIYPQAAPVAEPIIIIHEAPATLTPSITITEPVFVGPMVQPVPVRGWHRFRH